MPLLDASYLPPAIFILTHVLGVAGVLYWKRCARGRAELKGTLPINQPNFLLSPALVRSYSFCLKVGSDCRTYNLWTIHSVDRVLF